jgi:phenylalanyl-tRNA synthetase beta chain
VLNRRLSLSIEPVKVVLPNGQSKISPDLSGRQMIAHASYINACTGLLLTSQEVSKLLTRMALITTISPNDSDEISVHIPATRPDILHECDVMEDAAIAYGFNNLPDKFPTTNTVAQPLAISRLSDVIRQEWAIAGWVEVLPLILVSSRSNS